MCDFYSVHIKNTWGKLGHLGHRVFIGFAPPQLFVMELGQLGQHIRSRSRKCGFLRAK